MTSLCREMTGLLAAALAAGSHLRGHWLHPKDARVLR